MLQSLYINVDDRLKRGYNIVLEHIYDDDDDDHYNIFREREKVAS